MDTHLATTQIRLQQWTGIIQDRINSGLKVDEYCEQHQLSRNAYYYWLRKVKEAALISAGSRFTELQVPAQNSVNEDSAVQRLIAEQTFSPQLIITYGDAVISVNENTSKELLAMVCEVIRHA